MTCSAVAIYVKYQTQSSLYRNQSHLATVGQYGRFRAQFRYDEIPHLYTNTARTPYTETQPGVYTLPLIIRQSLQTASSTGTGGADQQQLAELHRDAAGARRTIHRSANSAADGHGPVQLQLHAGVER